jgi:hypothetical protein
MPKRKFSLGIPGEAPTCPSIDTGVSVISSPTQVPNLVIAELVGGSPSHERGKKKDQESKHRR